MGKAYGRMAGLILMIAAMTSGSASALTICVEGTYPPFSERKDDGSFAGFDIDMTAALCAEIGESCRLRETRWSQMIPTLVSGKCDAIIASMSDTPARRTQIDFTTRYYRSPVQLVARATSALATDPDALAGRTVGVQRDTVNQTFMQRHHPDAHLKVYGNQEHVLLDLDIGRLDAVMGETIQLDSGFLETPAGVGFVLVGKPQFDPAIQGSGAAIGVRKEDTDLRDRLSAAIAALRADGRYEAIARRYFDFDIYGSDG